jgi:hypothetical protein
VSKERAQEFLTQFIAWDQQQIADFQRSGDNSIMTRITFLEFMATNRARIQLAILQELMSDEDVAPASVIIQ